MRGEEVGVSELISPESTDRAFRECSRMSSRLIRGDCGRSHFTAVCGPVGNEISLQLTGLNRRRKWGGQRNNVFACGYDVLLTRSQSEALIWLLKAVRACGNKLTKERSCPHHVWKAANCGKSLREYMYVRRAGAVSATGCKTAEAIGVFAASKSRLSGRVRAASRVPVMARIDGCPCS